MLKAFVDGSAGLRLTMVDESPSVYLDHWALRTIADTQKWSEGLTAAIERASGTLHVSAWNILEFSKVRGAATIRRAEELLEACLPRLFFLECDPQIVIQRENALLAGAGSLPPHGDLDILEILFSFEPHRFESIGIRGLFDAVRDSGLDQRTLELGEAFKSLVVELRDELASFPGLRASARRTPPGPGLQRATRFILREMVRPLSLQQKMKLSPNDALDFLHGVVPIAYSDYVLLDKRWASLGKQAVQRLRRAGHASQMAEIFSGKRGQIEAFLATLERGSKSPNQTPAPDGFAAGEG